MAPACSYHEVLISPLDATQTGMLVVSSRPELAAYTGKQGWGDGEG